MLPPSGRVCGADTPRRCSESCCEGVVAEARRGKALAERLNLILQGALQDFVCENAISGINSFPWTVLPPVSQRTFPRERIFLNFTRFTQLRDHLKRCPHSYSHECTALNRTRYSAAFERGGKKSITFSRTLKPFITFHKISFRTQSVAYVLT